MPKNRMVIHYINAHFRRFGGHFVCFPKGTSTVTLVPMPVSDRISIRPPSTFDLSLIPIKPSPEWLSPFPLVCSASKPRPLSKTETDIRSEERRVGKE